MEPPKADPCNTCGSKKPGKIKGALNLLKAELGVDYAGDETVADRKAKCESCEHNDIGRCNACGCYLWAKVRSKKQTCPAGKW